MQDIFRTALETEADFRAAGPRHERNQTFIGFPRIINASPGDFQPALNDFLTDLSSIRCGNVENIVNKIETNKTRIDVAGNRLYYKPGAAFPKCAALNHKGGTIAAA